ncbi:hypothetical protein ACRALDRAFT_1080484 [Sodiomyces alcalophilus JCM 7366]|uniref:uncharacterized protein n=1 Tax=Sodiomyces alcalophilus JCM 7366 TaxID=591952 RepID=UPI0039B585E6
MRPIQSLVLLVAFAVATPICALPTTQALHKPDSSLTPIQPAQTEEYMPLVDVPSTGLEKRAKHRTKHRIHQKSRDQLTDDEFMALRLQKDVKKGIDWSLIPECYARCYRALAGPGAKDNSKLTIGEFCGDSTATVSILWHLGVKRCLALCPNPGGKALRMYNAWYINNCK